ncbi:MAG TPA: YidC/Oxa1 family membrane protein insertase [Candidatus Onthovicinus excrementipullorum]|nr:YidC/Oxa1 family membrane protein insertase [Candidatus Onthovicinus excrementipullorum]
MSEFFSFLYIPFGWLLHWIYEFIGSYGWSLILFTILVRLLMFPLSVSQQNGSAKQARLQPKIAKIRQRYAGNQVKMNEEMQKLYDRENYNMMSISGCLPLLIQFPIIIGLFGVIYRPLTYVLQIPEESVTALTGAAQSIMEAAGTWTSRSVSFVEVSVLNMKDEVIAASGVTQDVANIIQNFDFNFLGFPLGEVPEFKNPSYLWIMPVCSFLSSLLTGIYTFLRQRKLNPEMAKNPMMGCMSFFMPLFSLYLSFQFPVGISIYWTVSNLIAFAQMVLLNHTHSPEKVIAKQMIKEEIYRHSRENNVKQIVKTHSGE